jgi:hypothetical protein
MRRESAEKRKAGADDELKAACILWGYQDVHSVEVGVELDLTGESRRDVAMACCREHTAFARPHRGNFSAIGQCDVNVTRRAGATASTLSDQLLDARATYQFH